MRNDPRDNARKFEELIEDFKLIDMKEHCETIWKILAAILILGEIRFVEGNNGEAELDNNEVANKGKTLNSETQHCRHFANFVSILKGT